MIAVGSTVMASVRRATATDRLAHLDIIRGATILWVTIFHFYVDTRGVSVLGAGPEGFLSAAGHGNVIAAIGVAARALVGIPGYRLHVFLLLSGLVLSLGRPVPAAEFFKRRARAILPNYWLGSLAAFLLVAALAELRAALVGGGFLAQLKGGTLLAGAPYRFEWPDLLRSAAILGRFENARAMQAVAPSLWYVVLVGQLYVAFPLLRGTLRRLGPWWFLATAAALTWGGRAFAFQHLVVPGFDPVQTVNCFLPFRLLPAAAGMVVALEADRLGFQPRGPMLWLLSPLAVACLVGAAWLSLDVNTPGTRLALVGGIVPLVVSFPALWALALLAAAGHLPRTVLTWAGRNSLSVLVAQDFLRVGVGTLLALRGHLADLTWALMPLYLGLALGLAWVWHRLPRAVGARIWPPSSIKAAGLEPQGSRGS